MPASPQPRITTSYMAFMEVLLTFSSVSAAKSPVHTKYSITYFSKKQNGKSGEKARKEIYDFYLTQTVRINNWDLVDLSAPYIVGEYLKDNPREDLYRLADSTLLWEQRIAVVSTITLIRNDDFIDILRLSELLLHHKHDLMQKAIGWMLREMGKRDQNLLLQFLDKHAGEMPRTMLRYSIEKLTEEERKYYMKR